MEEDWSKISDKSYDEIDSGEEKKEDSKEEEKKESESEDI